VKTLTTMNKKRMLKAARNRCQVTYKGKPIKIPYFSMETLKARRALNDVFQVLKEKNC
jgi:hypothetical protein